MRRAPLIMLLIVLVLPAVAAARPASALWATVNVCDTAGAPNSMGVRAAMPGDGTRARMYVRFTAQFFSHKRERWVTTAGQGRSPWLYVGRARYRSLQAGWTFPFAAPPEGTVFRVRAAAQFEWRMRKRGRSVVITRRKRVTEAGVRDAEGGDPAGTSRASCDIT